MKKISKTKSKTLNSIFSINKEEGKTPVWNDELKMYVIDQYTSKSGINYCIGMRSSDRLVTVTHMTKDGNGSINYNEVEVYIIDTKGRKLIGKFSTEGCNALDFVRSTTESIVESYVEGQLKILGITVGEEELERQVKGLVEQTMTKNEI